MIIGVTILSLSKLRQHESIDKSNYIKLYNQITDNNYIVPILVDSRSLVILDGHHRYTILKSLGYTTIPVILVDYFDASIQVSSWRRDFKVTKQEVIRRGLTGQLYPPKTSKHKTNITPKKILLAKLR